MKRALLISFALLLVAACTSGSTNDGSLAICRNLPTNTSCSVDLSYLSCTYFDDAGAQQTELCLSDNVNECPDGNGIGGTCINQCKGGEYGAVCVGASDAGAPGNIAPPSPNCRLLATGSDIYCCPCGS